MKKIDKNYWVLRRKRSLSSIKRTSRMSRDGLNRMIKKSTAILISWETRSRFTASFPSNRHRMILFRILPISTMRSGALLLSVRLRSIRPPRLLKPRPKPPSSQVSWNKSSWLAWIHKKQTWVWANSATRADRRTFRLLPRPKRRRTITNAWAATSAPSAWMKVSKFRCQVIKEKVTKSWMVEKPRPKLPENE